MLRRWLTQSVTTFFCSLPLALLLFIAAFFVEGQWYDLFPAYLQALEDSCDPLPSDYDDMSATMNISTVMVYSLVSIYLIGAARKSEWKKSGWIGLVWGLALLIGAPLYLLSHPSQFPGVPKWQMYGGGIGFFNVWSLAMIGFGAWSFRRKTLSRRNAQETEISQEGVWPPAPRIEKEHS